MAPDEPDARGGERGEAAIEDAIDVWVIAPEELPGEELARAEPWMTPEERARQRAFVFERHRREYLVTRGLVRAVLSRGGARAPADWTFRRNDYGRPELDPPCGLAFNLSNHPTLVACAVRRGPLDLGCDVEPLARGPEVLTVADSVFAPAELAELRALPATAQPDRALALWTLKEAYIKARGMGLSLPLQDFAFSFVAGATARPSGIAFAPSLADDPRRWRFVCVDALGHRLALAFEDRGGRCAIHVRKLSGFTSDARVIDLASV
ncbi:MAG: 4'-phosphopantetheinyl transferase superfamily protein [Kofleriaceae bacterium]